MGRKANNTVFSAFTLIEVIIVVGIIAFLAVIALSSYRGQYQKGVDAKRKGNLQRMRVAIEEYEKDKNCYPPADIVVCNDGYGLKPYLSKIPCDPVTKESYLYEAGGGSPNCAGWYRIYSYLFNKGTIVMVPGRGSYNYYVSSPNSPPMLFGCNSSAQCVSYSKDSCNPQFSSPNCEDTCKDVPTRPENECR